MRLIDKNPRRTACIDRLPSRFRRRVEGSLRDRDAASAASFSLSAKCESEFDRAAYFPVTTRPQADRYPRANARSLDFNVSAVRSRSRSLRTLRFLVSIMPYARYGALRRCLTGSLRRRSPVLQRGERGEDYLARETIVAASAASVSLLKTATVISVNISITVTARLQRARPDNTRDNGESRASRARPVHKSNRYFTIEGAEPLQATL